MKLNKTQKIILIILAVLVAIGTAIALVTKKGTEVASKLFTISNPEIARSMTYTQVQPGDEIVSGTDDNVKFDAFFLRDLDNDGIAEAIRGTCQRIGGQDTLYMELNVLTEGYLKDGVITINGQNFYLATVLPKDSELKDSYIGNDIQELELNQISNGTQKTIMGIVRSGDYTYQSTKTEAIGKNINNYSRSDNEIVLTGTYVNGQNEEIQIEKRVPLTVDWHGITTARIYNTSLAYNSYSDLDDRMDETNETITLNFIVYTEEIAEELSISKNVTEITIPQLNGYDPIEVTTTTTGVECEYNVTTRVFTITKEATVDTETGKITKSISRNNSYMIEVVYPLEAYQTLGEESITLQIPVKTCYEGYNNPNNEFMNPYKSNIATALVLANYKKYVPVVSGPTMEIKVGQYSTIPTKRYYVSKQKPIQIYNNADVIGEDLYTVMWRISTGTNGADKKIVLKETANGETQVVDQFIKTDATLDSMEEITTNVGIYFNAGVDSTLKADGEIKIYDEETGNLLVTFTKDGRDGSKRWGAYSKNNPYRYEYPVKHIIVETSEVNASSHLFVYNIKALDDEYIKENYTREQFDELCYIKSTLTAYLGGTQVGTITHQAVYEAPMTIATIELSKSVISTQITEENEIITITAKEIANTNQIGWLNGSFLIKLPDEIIDLEINSVNISNNNVSITNYEIIEQEISGTIVKFIKINTENNSEKEQNYTITVDCNLTPDPRIATVNREVELYASNEVGADYYYKSADIYDVNNNLNILENVNNTTTPISLVSPNSLLTNQTISEFDDEGTVVISPNIADIKPALVNVANEDNEATIGIQLKNNYASTISEVVLIGKIPFEDNTTVLTNRDLGSEFTTVMKAGGITIPAELQNSVTIYYSEQENPNKNINDTANGWKLAEDVTNWSSIKTYLIDFGDTIIEQGQEYTFSYVVKIPNGTELNKVSYSHHGIYFALDTDQGKYRTSTEPNKVGVRVADLYNLQLIKYQTGKNKLVPGATYSVTEIENSGTNEEAYGSTRTATTDENGKLTINKLYAEKVYEIRETKSPADYELNSNTIRFIAHANRETGVITVEKISGTTKGNITVIKPEGEDYKVQVSVEDEAKASLKITKKEQGTENTIKGASYKLTGEGQPESGRRITTDINGEIKIQGIKIGSEYILEEIKAPAGYYVNENQIEFKIINNNGTYELYIKENNTYVLAENCAFHTEITGATITEENSIPTISLTLVDEKIPTYNLELIKIKKQTIVDGEQQNEPEIEYLSNAKFRLFKGTEKIGDYITDSNGRITINNLYQYIESKDVDQTYTLKEILPPDGYSKVKDITFKIDGTAKYADNSEELVFVETLEQGQTAKQYIVEGDTIKVTVEDNPSFKLVKKDGDTNLPLANVKFAIYNTDSGEEPARNSKGEILGTKETINGQEYYVVTTNASGEITLDLPEGIYKAVEVEADEKYDISRSTYYFGVGASREPKMTYVPEWAMSVGAEISDKFTSVTMASDGGYVAVGYFHSSIITAGDYILQNKSEAQNSNSYDAMIVKYNKDGEVDWANSIGGTSDDRFEKVTTLTGGGYVAVGYYRSTSISANNVLLTNDQSTYYDGMIVEFNEDGDIVWAEGIGREGADKLTGVVATSDGGFCAVGYFANPITIGTDTVHSASIIKYGSTREVEWATSLGGASNVKLSDIIETSDESIVIVGYFDYETTLGSDTIKSASIIKYSSDGNCIWARSIGTSTNDQFTGVAEIEGEYIVVGYFTSDITAGDFSLIRNGTSNSDGMIIKYNENGEITWADRMGGTNTEQLLDVKVMQDGSYVVVGYYVSTFTIGEYILKGEVSQEGMIIKYSSNNEVEWASNLAGSSSESINEIIVTSNGEYVVVGVGAEVVLGNNIISPLGAKIIKYKEKELPTAYTSIVQSLGGTSADQLLDVAKMPDGGFVAVGYFSDTIIVNGQTLTSDGDTDGIILKYSASGYIEWVETIKGTKDEELEGVAATSDGGCIVVGNYKSSSIKVGDFILEGSGTINSDGLIIKYSSNGEVEWANKFGGTGTEEFKSVIETSDKGFVTVGDFNSSTLGIVNRGNSDGLIIKYLSNGAMSWARSVGGAGIDSLTDITETEDGEYVAVGYSTSNSIMAEEKITLSAGNYDGFVVKYSSDGGAKWISNVGGTGQDYLYGIESTDNNGFIVVGAYNSTTVTIGEYTLRRTGSYHTDGMIIEYNSNNTVKCARKVGGDHYEYLYKITKTKDEGYVVVGYFQSNIITVDGHTIVKIPNVENTVYKDGMIIKYDKDINAEYACSIGGIYNDIIRSVTGLDDGSYVAVGEFNSSSITVGDYTLTNVGSTDSLLVKQTLIYGAAEATELDVTNNRKEYKITTHVQEIDGIKGGSISGEDRKPYETVKHGDNSLNEIVMIPDTDYEIISITVNGEPYTFTPEVDGTFTMPQFTNVTENKHIVVTYSRQENKITINKVDKNTGVPLTGAKFRLDQIEEREEPNQNIIGSLTDNSDNFYEPNLEDEITGVLGSIVNDGTHNFIGANFPYTSDNTTETATSYITLDLTGLTGKYYAVISAQASDTFSGYGYAHITTTTSIPSRTSTTDRVFHTAGSNLTTEQQYTSFALDGGNTYYIHLGCYKSSESEAQLSINDIKIYSANTYTYNFIDNNGKYESTNQGKPNTTSNSYVPIDLTGLIGKYNITVNVEISSISGDYGYVTLSNSTDRPEYNTTSGVTRFVYTSGESQPAADYTTEAEGGNIYYLHLGYYKNASTDDPIDKFTINSIQVTTSGSELYHTTVSTNNEGQAITQIPFGKYMVTEIETPEGYFTNDSIPDIEFRSDANATHEFTVEDEKIANITVHHYKKGTTEKVAEDEEQTGTIGEEYTTNPRLDLARYELEKDQNDEYILPLNKEGEFTQEDQEVIYEYVTRDIPLTVHHYIEGTATPVPLLDGTPAEDVLSMGEEHETYTTTAIPDAELSAEYELSEIPENANGTYEYDEVIVTYYYKPVIRTLTINKIDEDDGTPLEGVEFAIINDTNKITSFKPMTNNGTYYFVKDGNGYVPNNIGASSETSANSYIKIDMREATESTTVTINVEKTGTNSCGVARITKNPTAVIYSSDEGRFMYITSSTTATNYTTTLQPGSVYYLHLTYYISNSEGVSSIFRINSIKIDGILQDDITENNCQIKVKLPAGENKIKEIEQPEGYVLPDNTITNVNITKTSENVVNITNRHEKGTVIVHHYIEGTTTKVPSNVDGEVVEDETKVGNIGDIYVTQPSADVYMAYECINENPINSSGEYTDETIEVTYYYRPIKVKITTRVEGIGGTISGQNETPYEEVLLGGTSVKEIKATPDDKYFVKTITVNGDPIDFEPADDDTVTLSQFTNMMEDKEVVVTFEKYPSLVIVHHYLEGTVEKLAEDERIVKPEGEDYTTTKSPDVPANYTCVNETPENYQGLMGEEPIIVIYYYRLIEETITNNITKTADADKTESNVEVITEEEGKVKYTIKYTVNVEDYIGKVTYTIVDQLPLTIDITKSDLDGGIYDSNTKTITWNGTLEGINTYTNGVYSRTITKTIEVVYNVTNVTGDITNTVIGTAKTYYPDDYPENGGEEKKTVTSNDTEIVEQHYMTDKSVQKVWDDNDNERNKRPSSVVIQITANGQETYEGETLPSVELSEENSWRHTFEDLDKYDKFGNEIRYSVVEKEKNTGDLHYYEEARITGEDPIVITNEIKLIEAQMDSKIVKEGTEETEKPEEGIDYKITYTNKIIDYTGRAKITIIDNLPYKIDEAKSVLDGGTYDENTKTITWEQNENIEDTKDIEIIKNIKLVYLDIDLSSDRIINNVKAKIELIDEDKKNEVEDDFETKIIVKGKVIAKYVDEDGNKLAEDEESLGYIGEKYETEEKTIKYYKLVKIPENKEGKYAEEDTEVVYVYKKMLFNLGVNKIVEKITKDGKEINITDNKLAKLDIPKKEAENTRIKIKYAIIVTNTEEVEGTTEVVEYIPKGFKATEETLKEWKQSGEQQLTRTIELGAGETKKLEVEMQWDNDEDKLGYVLNKVSLENVETPANVKETTEEDNKSEAGVILSIKTGIDWKYSMAVTFIAAITVLGTTIITDKK